MFYKSIAVLMIFLSSGSMAIAQNASPPKAIAPTSVNAKVETVDPSAKIILPDRLAIEKLATGFKFTEGPLWTRQGYLIFSDIPANTIYKLDREGKVSVFVNNSGYLGEAPKKGAKGSNGITYDKNDNVIFTQHGDRAVVRLTQGGKKEVIVNSYNGKRLNSPNDLVVMSNGAIYFTDPPYGLSKLNDDPAKEQPVNGIYRYDKDKLLLLASDLTYPNGIAFSPDEQFLYVGSSDPNRQVLMRYRVNSDGTLADGAVFAKTFVDGMKVDTRGNLYISAPEGIKIFSPTGKHLATIKLPEEPTNLAWGGEDYRSLYVAAKTSIYRLRLNVAGIQP